MAVSGTRGDLAHVRVAASLRGGYRVIWLLSSGKEAHDAMEPELDNLELQGLDRLARHPDDRVQPISRRRSFAKCRDIDQATYGKGVPAWREWDH
jgi:hypothetical protein